MLLRTPTRHRKTGLSIFDADSVALTKTQMRQQVAEGKLVVTRHVRIFQVCGNDLVKTLDTADAIFTRLADKCGATVVEHTWGLYPTDTRPGKLAKHLGSAACIPHGYAVAAQVETLHDVSYPEPSSQLHVRKVIKDHLLEPLDDSPRWWDADASHFVMACRQAEVQPSLYLLDIEPLLETGELYF